MSQSSPLDRIDYKGELTPLVENICADYQLGTLLQHELITVGYEDCNTKFVSENGVYLAKILSKERNPQNVKRYEDIILHVNDAGISAPKPLTSPRGGGLIYRSKSQNIIVQEFVEGATFYERDDPNDTELLMIAEQASKINAIDYRPTFLNDTWAVPSISDMHVSVRSFLSDHENNLIDTVIGRYQQILVEDLPHAFVHGDIISTNVVKSTLGQMYILDFSVANWYPRVQELAVMASSLLSSGSLSERCDRVVEAYEHFSRLQDIEKKHLYVYALSAVAMELIGASYEKFVHGNESLENQHWMNLGRRELEKEIKL